MPALTPTVHERVGRCATRVYVNGLIAGAQVVLSVDGTDFTHTATGGGHTFVVPPLDPGARLSATQDDGSGPTPPSPTVVVEDVALPPAASPLFPGEVGSCSHCIRLTGLVPGCDVEIMQAGNVVGSGTASRHGDACITVRLRGGHGDPGPDLTARMIVCGQPGPFSGTALVGDGPLAAPTIPGPLFGCQSVVPLRGLRRGAKSSMETDTGTYLGWICNCWTDVNVNVLHRLVPGEKVRGRQYWDGDSCNLDGPWSDWVDVVPPDERIKPTVEEALVEGDQLIRVTGQIGGSELVVLIRDDPAATIQRFGPRPASPDDPEIALNKPLMKGQQVAVEQHLCGHMEVSDWVTVLPAPPVVTAPVILPPLFECAGVVQVSGLLPGAVVRVFQDGIPSGLAWAGLSNSVAVAAAPALVAGAKVTAQQWVGGVASPVSDPVIVQPTKELHEPRILEPVAVGDTRVWVSGVTPGALVSIRSSGVLVGERYAAESLVAVDLATAVDGVVHPTVRLCDQTRTGPRVSAIEGPCAGRSTTPVGERTVDLGMFPVPEHPNARGGTDGGFEHPIAGRLYHPIDDRGQIPDHVRGWPLVVVAHGLHYFDQQDQSHRGYGYLAHHLVRWGMIVLSLDLAKVNEETDPNLQQWSRGEIVLETVRRVVADSTLGPLVDRDRVGLVGHSMGGEGVVVAQSLNQSQGSPFGIRGVVSLAPTYWEPRFRLEDTRYLQLYGSHDRLLQSPSMVTGADPPWNGFRIYDKAWRPRTFVWVHGARHRGWNTNWWNSTVEPPPTLGPGELDLGPHLRIARCFVNAFFQDALLGRGEYAEYLHGPGLPASVVGLDVFPIHHPLSSRVIDDFGDAADQFGQAEETPIDRTSNRAGGASQAAGAGMDRWEDTEHVGVHARSVHDTISTDLAWLQPDMTYSAEFPPIALGPSSRLTFQVAQHYDESGGSPVATYNQVGIDVDLLVTVGDGARTATVRMGSAGDAPYPAPAPQPWAVLRTVDLPLDAFVAVESSLQLGTIRSVEFKLALHPTGRVLIDDVEFVT